MAKKIKTPVERNYQEEAAQKLKDAIMLPTPPVSRCYNVGDLVEFGAHPNAQVEDVYFDGKIYKIKLWGTYYKYGVPYEDESYMVVRWVDLLPYRTVEDRTIQHDLVHNKDVNLNYLNMDIYSLISTYYGFGINMNPEYQRDYVWEESDNIELIDSIFNNRNIGNYILVHNGYGEGYGYEVLDGKQRIAAIINFYEDRYRYKGKLFSELSTYEQNWFKGYHFGRAEIKGNNGSEIIHTEQKIKIFLHVNNTGKVMDKAHLEKVKAMLK